MRYSIGDFEFEINTTQDEKHAVITGYKGAETEVCIPNVLDFLPVLVIGYGMFYPGIRFGTAEPGSEKYEKEHESTEITDIYIPTGIKKIDPGAFMDCNKLVSLRVDKENKCYRDIDGILFDKDIKTLIHYPSGRKCSIYKIPSGITKIERFAFERSNNLTRVIFPDGLAFIGESAFG
jgi:hypothetical protein